MARLRTYRPIEFRQLCAIARVVLLRTPSMTDAEWKAQTKDACQKQGYDEPGDMLPRALSAVEHSMRQTMGPRPIVEDAPAAPAKKPDVVPLTPKEWKAFAATLHNVLVRSRAMTAPSNVTPIARETLEIEEPAAIDEFYSQANAGDRLGALRRFAEIAILRPADWDPAAVRATSGQHLLHADRCFACRTSERVLAWHHIIQIQHGGSNYLRNRVALCDPCHADIHPWLTQVPRTKGWARLVDLVPTATAMLSELRQKDEAS